MNNFEIYFLKTNNFNFETLDTNLVILTFENKWYTNSFGCVYNSQRNLEHTLSFFISHNDSSSWTFFVLHHLTLGFGNSSQIIYILSWSCHFWKSENNLDSTSHRRPHGTIRRVHVTSFLFTCFFGHFILGHGHFMHNTSIALRGILKFNI